MTKYAVILLSSILASCGGSSGSSFIGTQSTDTENTSDTSALFSSPVLLFEELNDGSSYSQQFTIGDDRILASAVGDFNGDGRDDIVMTFPGYDTESGDRIGAAIRIFIQTADEELIEATEEIIIGDIPSTQFTRRILVADFNGDGTDDIFLANHGLELPTENPGADWHEPDTLLLSTPNGNLIDASSNLPGLNDFYTHGATSGDIDGDGDIDILTNANNWPPVGIQVYVNDGFGNFSLNNSAIPSFEYLPGQFAGVNGDLWIELIDADGDGDLDLFKAGNTAETHYIVLNDGTGDFTYQSPILLPALFWWDSLVEGAQVSDFNQDGLDDLLLINTNNNAEPWDHRLQLLISNGDGTYTDETTSRLPEPAGNTTNTLTFIVDLNNDGYPDILNTVGDSANTLLDFYINDGAGFFTRIEGDYLPGLTASYLPIDLGGDGDIDFIGSGWNDALGVNGAFVLEALRTPSL